MGDWTTNYDDFTGEIEHRLELPGTGETVRAIRATLTTLGERIQEDEAEDLASPLPTGSTSTCRERSTNTVGGSTGTSSSSASGKVRG